MTDESSNRRVADSEMRQNFEAWAMETFSLSAEQLRLGPKPYSDDAMDTAWKAWQAGMRAGEIAQQGNYVYTISVVSGVDRELRWREWGYYFNESHAREAIEKNCTDISENDYYHFGILSRKGQGPLAIPEVIQWYEFIYEGNEFVRADKIECPEQYRHMAGENGERLWPLPAAPEEKKP